ncbi:MAG: hypothetical protein QHH14_14480, partial [Clostridiales bacterium]|nr:hypothetical protein [Clostridiales bacterium]
DMMRNFRNDETRKTRHLNSPKASFILKDGKRAQISHSQKRKPIIGLAADSRPGLIAPSSDNSKSDGGRGKRI